MRKVLVRGIAALALMVGSPAVAQYSGVYTFGASLEDAGNFQAASNYVDSLPPPAPDLADPTPASMGYFDGRYSDGYSASDLLSLHFMGVPLSETFPYGISAPLPITPAPPPVGTSLCFAYGGAQVLQDMSLRRSLEKQMDAYLAIAGAPDPTALYVVSIGANDMANLLPPAGPVAPGVATPFLTTLVDAIMGQVSRLYSAGANTILLSSGADTGILPTFTGLPDEAARRAATSAFSDEFQTLMQARVGALGLSGQQSLTLFSIQDFTDAVRASPGTYGISNTTQACLAVETPSPSINCSGYLFFDDVHFSATANRAIAAAMIGGLAGSVPEIETWLMMMLGFVGAGRAMRRGERRGALARAC